MVTRTELERENELLIKAVHWTLESVKALYAAGGNGSAVLDLPEDFVVSCIRNNIIFTHKNNSYDTPFG